MHTTHRSLNRYAITLVMLTIAMTAGCETKFHDVETFMGDQSQPMVMEERYRLMPPDEIRITSSDVPEVDGHREIVRPDGYITLPLLGSVFVAGRTPEQVTEKLNELAKRYFEKAHISLRVSRFNSKKVYVFGEVTHPGPVIYDGASTVLELLAASQPTRLADQERIILVRPDENTNDAALMTIDMEQMVRRGDMSRNAVLREGDILWVPPHGLAKVGLALQQVLLPIQPASAVVRAPSSFESSFTGGTYGTEGNR